jgi:hypothetical protein
VAEIVVAPIVIELGINRAQYESVVQDLQEAGHRASLHQPEERRSTGGVAAQAAYGLTIYLLARVGDEVVDEIIETVKRRLRLGHAYRDRRRAGVIYGPGNDVLRTFELPEGDSGDADE